MTNTGNSSRRVNVRSYTVDANGALVNFEETTKVVGTSDAYIKIFEDGWKASGLQDVSYMNFTDCGMVLGTGCGTPEMTRRSSRMQEAYRLGKSL